MGRSKALILAAAAVIGASASARAADLLPPPPMVEPPPPVDFGGWYLRGDVGVGALQISSWRHTLQPNAFGALPNGPILPLYANLGDTAFAGAGVGYQINNWFRFDVTGEYRIMSNYNAGIAWTFPGATNIGLDQYHASLGTALFMANGYVDLGTWCGITPFVGAGVGVAFHNLQGLTDYGLGLGNGGFGFARDTQPTNFAWAVMAGLGYNVTPNLKLEVGYRFLDMDRVTSNPIACSAAAACFHERHSFNVVSHDVRLGFRYLIASAPPPVLMPPPPLIRKY